MQIYAQAFSRKQITYTQGSPRNSEKFQNITIHTQKSCEKETCSFLEKMSDTTLKVDGPKAGKYNKPLLERQRRARINKSLDQIKELILSNLYKNDPKTFAEKNNERMDKAEILEFAVDYIKDQKLMQYASRPTRTNSPPSPHDQIIDPRLQYISSLPPPPPMPYAGYSTSERLKIDHPQQPQPWMSLVRCTERCCVPYYGNISPIPSPKFSMPHSAVENVNGQTKDNESFGYSKSVWRPW